MLFVWLFAMLASWANACLVQPAAHPATERAHHVHAGAAAAHHDAHGPAAAHPTWESDPAQEVCAEFCEAEQSIVAQPQASKGVGAAEPTPFPPTVPAGWPLFVPGRLEPRWRPLAAPPPLRVHVAIAFLRLTL